MLHAGMDVVQNLVHAWQFKNQLPTRLENAHPLCQHLGGLPCVEVLDYMDCRDVVSVVVGKREIS